MQHSSSLKPTAQKPVAVIVPIPQNLVQPVTAQGFNSEITGLQGVSWPIRSLISTTCSGQISWVWTNIWETIRVNAQRCTQQQAPRRNNQASKVSARKNTSTTALPHNKPQEPFLEVGEKAGNHHWFESSWNEQSCLTGERHWGW